MEKEMTGTVDQFNLKWGMHYPNFIECFSEHRRSGSLVDVTLTCEGKNLGAHKLILAACSGYFQSLFKKALVGFPSCMSMLLHPIVVLPGKYEHLKSVLDFIYQGEVQVLDSDLKGVLELGEFLQVKGLSAVKLNDPEKFSTGGSTATEQMRRGGDKERKPLVDTRPVVVLDTEDELDFTPPDSKDFNGRLTVQEQGTKDAIEGEPSLKRLKESTNSKSVKTYGKRSRLGHENATVSLRDDVPEERRAVLEIPQVVNPFMLFANGFRNKVAADHPDESSKQISIRLSQMWNTLSPEVKEPYYEAARKAQMEHEEKKSSEGMNDGESEGELKIDETVDAEN